MEPPEVSHSKPVVCDNCTSQLFWLRVSETGELLAKCVNCKQVVAYTVASLRVVSNPDPSYVALPRQIVTRIHAWEIAPINSTDGTFGGTR